MLSSMKCVAAPLAAVMLLASTAGSQPAAAFILRGIATEASSATTVTPVYGYGRRGGWGRGGYWRGPGAGIAILGGIIVGGALVAAAVAEHRASGDDMRRCARDFPNFDPRSGTYENRHGEVLVCPYLH